MPNLRKPSFLANIGEFAQKTAVNVCVSILVPLVSGFVGNIQTIDQIFLGGLVFIITLLGQIILDIAEIKKQRAPTIEFWKIQNEADRALSNVRASYAQIAAGRNQLYLQYFNRQMEDLARNIHEAASNEELRVAQDSDTTDIMLRPFSERSGRGIRAIHFFEDNEFMFDVHSTHFFCDVAERVISRKVQGVSRLFILKEDRELEDSRAKRLIEFHASTPNFDYRIVKKRDYDRIKRDFNLPTDTKDFAIYGDWYVYRTIVAADNEIKGIFSANEGAVRRFTAMFDKCWNSELAFKTSNTAGTALSLRELFGPDAVSPNRPNLIQHVSEPQALQLSSQPQDESKNDAH